MDDVSPIELHVFGLMLADRGSEAGLAPLSRYLAMFVGYEAIVCACYERITASSS